ncbi:MAG: DUF983 domain-containing protein [Bacteroidia bacterium]
MANGTVGSLITGKCPKCHQGKVFTHSFYNVMHYSQIHKSCPHCGVKFESELGFFWGAMYFSYALNVGVSIITGFSLFFFFNDPEFWVYISVIIPIMIILTPVMMRFSRLMMMYVVAPYRKYDPKYLKGNN